jgi:hypothetical protein
MFYKLMDALPRLTAFYGEIDSRQSFEQYLPESSQIHVYCYYCQYFVLKRYNFIPLSGLHKSRKTSFYGNRTADYGEFHLYGEISFPECKSAAVHSKASTASG